MHHTHHPIAIGDMGVQFDFGCGIRDHARDDVILARVVGDLHKGRTCGG